jgi:hypothetical protein
MDCAERARHDPFETVNVSPECCDFDPLSPLPTHHNALSSPCPKWLALNERNRSSELSQKVWVASRFVSMSPSGEVGIVNLVLDA